MIQTNEKIIKTKLVYLSLYLDQQSQAWLIIDQLMLIKHDA
jgi:hypothetical protein